MKRLTNILEEPISSYSIEYRVHATRRMFERQISNRDVDELLAKGEVIEEYDDSPPNRHVLVSGRSENRRPLHAAIVIQLVEKTLTLITIYEPDPGQWNDAFTKRTQ